MNRLFMAICGVLAVLLAQAITASPAQARSWTCFATIALSGSGAQYAPAQWDMSGGPLVDRENKCKGAIQSNWLNGAIWKLLGMSPEDQDKWCRTGGGTFMVNYGFDERKKDWNFSQYVPVTCQCGTGGGNNNPGNGPTPCAGLMTFS